MSYLFIALAFLLLIIFGCASISNSYASAKQAEASIEASQTAQLALGGQITISIVLALVVAILTFTVLTLLYHLSKKQSAASQCSANHFPQNDFAALGNADAQYQFPVVQNETENELSTLPSGWGW